VTCRRLLADFDSNGDGILDDEELVALFTFLMPCLSTAECRALLRTELPPLLPGGDTRGGGGGGQRKTAQTARPLSLADFQQLLTLDCTTLVTQAEAAQGTSLVEDAVQALMLICANDSQTLQPDPLMLETLVPLLREPCGSRLQVYALTALWSLLRCFQRSAVPVPQLTKPLARSVAACSFRLWSSLQCASQRPARTAPSPQQRADAFKAAQYSLACMWLMACDGHGRTALMGDHAPEVSKALAAQGGSHHHGGGARRTYLAEGVEVLLDIVTVECTDEAAEDGFTLRNLAMRGLYTLCIMSPQYRPVVTALGARFPLQAFARTAQRCHRTRGLAATLFFQMAEDAGAEGGWELGQPSRAKVDEKNHWHRIPLRRKPKLYHLERVLMSEQYSYRQTHFRELAVPPDADSDVYLAEGGLRSEALKLKPPPRYVGYMGNDKTAGAQLELRRAFLTEESCEFLLWCLTQSQPPLQRAGADGAALLAANHTLALGKLGVIDAAAVLLRDASTETATAARLLHALLNLSFHKENQVTIARKTMRVLVFLNDACTQFLHTFREASVDQETALAAQLEAALEVLRYSGGTLHNLLQHPANRTLVFRTELETRTRAAARANGLPPPPPPLRPAASRVAGEKGQELALATRESGAETAWACPERDLYDRLVDTFQPSAEEHAGGRLWEEGDDTDGHLGTLTAHEDDEQLRAVLTAKFIEPFRHLLLDDDSVHNSADNTHASPDEPQPLHPLGASRSSLKPPPVRRHPCFRILSVHRCPIQHAARSVRCIRWSRRISSPRVSTAFENAEVV
jgi:hypothetical protein